MWDLPGPGIKPASPALAGWFSTTVLPGKSKTTTFNVFIQVYQRDSKSFCIQVKVWLTYERIIYIYCTNECNYFMATCFFLNVSKRQQHAVKTSGCCQVIKKHRIMRDDWLPKSYSENRAIKEFIWKPMNQDSRQKEVPHKMIFRANQNKPD